MKATPKTDPMIKDALSEQASNREHSLSKKSKAIFLEQAGALSDDPSLSQLRDTIYQARGRSEIDNHVSS